MPYFIDTRPLFLLVAGALTVFLLTSVKIIGPEMPAGQILFAFGIYSFLPTLIYFGLRGDIPFRLAMPRPWFKRRFFLAIRLLSGF